MFFLVWEILIWQWFHLMFPRTVPLLVAADIKGTFQDEHLHQKGHACAEGHPCASWMSLSGRMVGRVRLDISVSCICEVCQSIFLHRSSFILGFLGHDLSLLFALSWGVISVFSSLTANPDCPVHGVWLLTCFKLS